MSSHEAIAAFRAAEARLLARNGIEAVEKVVRLRDPDLDARVLIAGEGSTVLYVHGGGAFGATWAPLAGTLPGWRHVMPDRPGFVLTPPVDLRGVDLRRHAVRFLSGLLDGLEVDAAHVVANSMGGLWALWLALDAPPRVRSLALLGAPALTGGSGGPLPMRLLGCRGLGRLMMALEPPSPRQARTLWRRMGIDPDRVDATVLDAWIAAERIPTHGEAWRALMARVFTLSGVRPDCALPADALGALRCPTLLVWGGTDPFGDAAFGERLARKIPGARFVTVDGGHLPWFDETAACSRALAEFLLAREALPRRPVESERRS